MPQGPELHGAVPQARWTDQTLHERGAQQVQDPIVARSAFWYPQSSYLVLLFCLVGTGLVVLLF